MIESATPLQQATLGTLFTWAVTAAGSGLGYCVLPFDKLLTVFQYILFPMPKDGYLIRRLDFQLVSC